ncbi:hypothetical protein ACFLU5_15960, partial [Bacteroidota bacterium]
MKLTSKHLLTCLIAGFVFSLSSISQTKSQDLKPITELFESDDIIKITLRSNFNYILSYRSEDREYQKADLIYEDENGFHEIDVKVESRGNFRRDSGNCDFPPLRLNFKKKDIKNTIFEGQEKLKIVTHCKEAFPEFIQYIFREYQVYKTYNLITDYSFRVRMTMIMYQDTDEVIPSITNYAFFIEDDDALAERHNMDKIDEKIQLTDLEPNNALTLALFEFMIGNTDWIVPFKKNLEIIGYGNKIIAVPYDFDYTKTVNIDYNKYGATIPLWPASRKYKGLCYNHETFEKAFKEFLDQKKPIYKEIRKSPYLN